MQYEDALETGQIGETYRLDDLHWSIGEEHTASPELAIALQTRRPNERVLVRTDWATVDGRLTAVRETIIRIL